MTHNDSGNFHLRVVAAVAPSTASDVDIEQQGLGYKIPSHVHIEQNCLTSV